MKPEKAKQILRKIMDKFPNHEITPKARAYLEHLG
jgi:hypothetical protein